MFVSALLCFLRDCMKGDETENKKIGCTVNLMVKMFSLSLCDTVQCCRNWGGKGWDRNLCQASVASESKHWDDRREWWGLRGSSGGSGPTRCLKQGQIGQVPKGCVQLSSVYPCDRGSTTSLTSSFSFWLPSFWKKIMPRSVWMWKELLLFFPNKNVFSFQ